MTRLARQHVNSNSSSSNNNNNNSTAARDNRPPSSASSSSSSSFSFASSNQHTGSRSRDSCGDNSDGHLRFRSEALDPLKSSSNSSDSTGPSTRNVRRLSSTFSTPFRISRRASSTQHDFQQAAFPSKIPQKVEPTNRSSTGSSATVFSTPQVVRKVSLSRTALFGSAHISPPASSSDSRQEVFQEAPERVPREKLLPDSSRRPRRNDEVFHSAPSDPTLRPGKDLAGSQSRIVPLESGECTDAEYLTAELDVLVEHFTGVDIENKEEWRRALKQLVSQLPSNPDLISDSHLTSLLTVLLSAPEDIDECSLMVAECLTTLLRSRRADQSLLVLREILDRSDQSNVVQTLRWIKFQLDGLRAADASKVMAALVGSVVKASDNDDKSVRTVAIMVLVQIHRLIGDQIWRYINGDINQHKKTLLQMYFGRTVKWQ